MTMLWLLLAATLAAGSHEQERGPGRNRARIPRKRKRETGQGTAFQVQNTVNTQRWALTAAWVEKTSLESMVTTDNQWVDPGETYCRRTQDTLMHFVSALTRAHLIREDPERSPKDRVAGTVACW